MNTQNLCKKILSTTGIFKRIARSCTSQQNPPMTVFDREVKYLQRQRAAKNPDHKVYDYIKDEVSYDIADRILDMTKKFEVGLDLGCGKGYIANNLPENCLSHLHMVEYSPAMLDLASKPESIDVTKHCLNEEGVLPFEDESIDVVFSNLSLHWVNNLPGTLKEVYRILQKDGVFIGSMFAGDTLYELRSAFILAELEREGGFASHVSPFTRINDVGMVLDNAGFSMLTIDTDDMVIRYPSLMDLMFDLQGMAENNSSIQRKVHLYRDTILAAEAIYREMYSKGEKGVPATFEIISMIGWKPDPRNPEHVSRPGSANVSMKDIDRLNELVREQGMEGRVQFIKEMDKKKRSTDEGDEGK